MKDDKRFYVYEWFNIESNEVFYVGKGNGNRYKIKTGRNRYFMNYINKYKCNVRKIKENLTEKEAFDLEIETIKKYRELNQCRCNICDGGEGATFEEGSWNALFRSLQYSHDIKNSTNELHNEEDYDSKNLKTKTTEELQHMYDKFQDHKRNIRECKELGVEFEEKLDPFELKIKNEEIYMLTDLMAKSVAKTNKKFKSYLKMNDEIDFHCASFKWDKFLDELIENGGMEYMKELIVTTRYNMRYIKKLGEKPHAKCYFILKSFNIREDDMWHVKFTPKDDKKVLRVKLDIKDLIMSLLISKGKTSYIDIIYGEIMSAPIYN